MLERKSLTWFLILTFAISWTFFLIPLAFKGDPAVYAQSVGICWMLGMWGPGIAAIVTTLFVAKRPISDLRLNKLGKFRFYLIAWFLPPLLAALTVAVTALIGTGVFDKVPFVCGCRNLGEALRRIGEGAAMIRTKGEAGTGDVVEAVRHARSVLGEMRRLQNMPEAELMAYAKEIGAPFELVMETRSLGRLPVVNFAAGGVATPADAALMMQLGVDGVFVGSGIFKSGDPARRAAAIVKAVTHFGDPYILAEVSRNLGEPMVGRQVSSIPEVELLATRGW